MLDSQIFNTLKYIFDAHLKLFNIRRDHEWRVIISVMVLMGAVDATLISQHIMLEGIHVIYWWVGLGLLFFSVFWYQWGVQVRNRVDRIAMDSVLFELCQNINIPEGNPIRAAIDRENEQSFVSNRCREVIFHKTYLWAFVPQMIVLAVATSFSAILPSLIEPDLGRHSQVQPDALVKARSATPSTE